MLDYVTNMEHPISIPYHGAELDGLLYLPHELKGVVIFAHGSGSSRFSPRNQAIAKELQEENFATLLFDLLTPEEEAVDSRTMQYRFDIEFLASRLITATEWIANTPAVQDQPIGYFGASTGGGAALVAAAREQNWVKAVVSRGGRPDLAGEALPYVKAATLLIVGGDDDVVIDLNKKAFQQLNCVKELKIIPGATHLFEEPGKLEEVARLARAWFKKYLG